MRSGTKLTRVCVGHWNLPDGDMRGDRGQELAQCQRHDELEVIPPRDVHVLADAPQVEERSAVDGDAGQLDHGHSHRVRELAEDHLADDIVAAGHHIPQDAQECDRHHLSSGGLVHGHDESQQARRRRPCNSREDN